MESKMKRKKYLLFIMVILIVVLCLGGLFFYKKYMRLRNESTLQSGLYFLKSKGYLVYNPKEEMQFSLLTYYYGGEKKDSEVIGKYCNFKIVTNEGKELEVDVTQDELLRFTNMDDEKVKQGNIRVVIPRDNSVEEQYNFTKMKYKDENGEDVTKDLGSINVKVTNKTNNDPLSIQLLRIDWIRYVSPIINKMEVEICNKSQDDIIVDKIDLGGLNIQLDWKETSIKRNETKEFEIPAKVIDEEKVNMVYYIKPEFQYQVNGNSMVGNVLNISRLRYVSDTKTLYEYFNSGGSN